MGVVMTNQSQQMKPPWFSIVMIALILGIAVIGLASQQQQPESPSATAQIEAPAAEEPANYDNTTYASIEEAARVCPGDVARIAGPADAPARYGCARSTSQRFGGS